MKPQWSIICLVAVTCILAATIVSPTHAETADDSRLRQLAGQSKTYSDEVWELLAKGADPNAPGQGGRTALHAAARIGAAETLQALLEAGGDPNRRDEDGNTPLHFASDASQATLMTEESIAAIRVLLRGGADASRANTKGRTPLHLAAASHEQSGGVVALLRAGADANRKDRDGATPLHAAVGPNRGRPRVVGALLNGGGDPSARNGDGLTVLQLFVRVAPDEGDTAALLIDAGADPDRKYPNGDAPLHAAIRSGGNRGKVDVAEALLAGGADPCVRDAKRYTPYQVAREGGAIHQALDRAGGHDFACDRSRVQITEVDRVMRAAKRSNVRGGPGTEHDKVGLLEVGDEVQVTGEIGDWLRIEAPRGGDAFVWAPLLTEEAPSRSSAATGTETAQALDIPDKATRKRVADWWEQCGRSHREILNLGVSRDVFTNDQEMYALLDYWDQHDSSISAMVKKYLDRCRAKFRSARQSERRCGELWREFRAIDAYIIEVIREPDRYLDPDGQYNERERGVIGEYLRLCVTAFAAALDGRVVGSVAQTEEKAPEVAARAPATQRGPLHGSISFSQESDGGYAWGIAWSFDSRAGALAEARDQCREYGGSYCAEVGWFQEACGALAIGDGNGYGAGWGDTLAEARRDALANCRVADCRVEVARCSQSQEAGGKGRRQREDTVAARAPDEDKPAAVLLEPKCLAQPLYVGSRCWKEFSNKPGCHFWLGRHNLHVSPSTDVPTAWSGTCADGVANGEGAITQEGGWWQIKFTGVLSNGKQHGYWDEILYDEDGNEFSWQKGSYAEGNRHGDWVQATDGGSRCDIAKYANDEVIDGKVNAC